MEILVPQEFNDSIFIDIQYMEMTMTMMLIRGYSDHGNADICFHGAAYNGTISDADDIRVHALNVFKIISGTLFLLFTVLVAKFSVGLLS